MSEIPSPEAPAPDNSDVTTPQPALVSPPSLPEQVASVPSDPTTQVTTPADETPESFPRTGDSGDQALIFATTSVPKPAPTPSIAVRSSGAYVALAAPHAANGGRGAMLSLKVDPTGKINGQLAVDGRRRQIRGGIDSQGVFSAKTVRIHGQPDYTLTMNAVDKGRSAVSRLVGHLSSSRGRVAVTMLASPWSKSKKARAFEGSYDITFRDATSRSKADVRRPAAATAVLTVAADGTASLAGRLSDRRAFSWSGRLAADGSVPVHVGVAPGRTLHGNLLIRAGSRQVSGNLIFVSPGQPKSSVSKSTWKASGRPAAAPRRSASAEKSLKNLTVAPCAPQKVVPDSRTLGTRTLYFSRYDVSLLLLHGQRKTSILYV